MKKTLVLIICLATILTSFSFVSCGKTLKYKDGNYYFIYSVKGVKNHINPKAKSRNEVIIVGINQKQLVTYLNNCARRTKDED